MKRNDTIRQEQYESIKRERLNRNKEVFTKMVVIKLQRTDQKLLTKINYSSV